jgi:hypothetical protein
VAEQLNTFLTLFNSAEASVGKAGPDPDIKQIFESLAVKQRGERTVLTANIPPGFIQKALSSPAEGTVVDKVIPEQTPAAPPTKK